jgi:regulatory protein
VERRPPSKRKDTQQPGPAARALKLLARRDHTRAELAAKLAPHVEDGAELEAVLDDLTSRGWLSESRVVEQVLHAKRQRLGPRRIRQLLLQRGVPEPLVASAMHAVKATELEAARSVWSRKYRAAASDRAEQARQVRFLQSRGFSLEVAMRVAGGRSRSEDEGA